MFSNDVFFSFTKMKVLELVSPQSPPIITAISTVSITTQRAPVLSLMESYIIRVPAAMSRGPDRGQLIKLRGVRKKMG